MRKRVFKRKKKILTATGSETRRNTGIAGSRAGLRARAAKAAAFAAAVSLLLGGAVTAYGQESGGGAVLKTVVTDILHKHIGSPSAGGGCYTSPIEHKHQGDAAAGGGCYTKPVLHKHTGSPAAGGGCYGKVIPHTQHGPQCYRSETHTHESACLSGRCTITYTEKELIETYTDTCLAHGVTTHERRAAIASHSACGQGEVDMIREQCQSCTNALTRTHMYINCGKQEGTTSILDCNKNIDGYDLSCGYEEGKAEYYERECDGAPDGYGLGCALDEGRACGRVILTSRDGAGSGKVLISARLEDFTAGGLILGGRPFVWKDREGNELGDGDSLEVEENGDYFVTVNLENKDVDESGLHSSISVDNIHKEETPAATPTVSPATSPAASPAESPVASPTASPAEYPAASPTVKPTTAPAATTAPSGQPQTTPSAEPASSPGADADKTPQASNRPQNPPGKEDENKEEEEPKGQDQGESSRPEDGGAGSKPSPAVGTAGKIPTQEKEQKEDFPEERSGGGSRKRSSDSEKRDPAPAEETQTSPSPSAEPKQKLEKDTKAVTVSGNNAAGEGQYQVGRQARKNGFFESAAVRVLTVTVSTLLLLGGALLLLVYLLCSVSVFNDDGEGRMVYLGRCLIRKKEEEYFLLITQAMTEKSCTNRYCIRPGLFRLGKKEDQELIVYREDKKTAAYLSKEMIVVL